MVKMVRKIANFIIFLFACIFALIGTLFSLAAMGFTYIGESIMEFYEEENLLQGKTNFKR